MLRFTNEGERIFIRTACRAAAIDVKTEFALRVLMAKINFTGRHVHALRYEMNW